MMTTRRFIGIALAGCWAIACLPMRLIEVAITTCCKYETQAVAMARLELTLAHWRKCADVADQLMRPDMRAKGNGAVFNGAPVPRAYHPAC